MGWRLDSAGWNLFADHFWKRKTSDLAANCELLIADPLAAIWGSQRISLDGARSSRGPLGTNDAAQIANGGEDELSEANGCCVYIYVRMHSIRHCTPLYCTHCVCMRIPASPFQSECQELTNFGGGKDAQTQTSLVILIIISYSQWTWLKLAALSAASICTSIAI